MNKCKVIHETFITELNDTIYFLWEKDVGANPRPFLLSCSACAVEDHAIHGGDLLNGDPGSVVHREDPFQFIHLSDAPGGGDVAAAVLPGVRPEPGHRDLGVQLHRQPEPDVQLGHLVLGQDSPRVSEPSRFLYHVVIACERGERRKLCRPILLGHSAVSLGGWMRQMEDIVIVSAHAL